MDAPINHPQLQERLGYRFKNLALLDEALRHSSFVNEQADAGLRDNERLEFLGDAVLNLAIGHLLMAAYPELHEGTLSRIRANIVNETQLAAAARDAALGSYLLLGKGESQTGGHEKNSILANTMEAMIAAIYLDSGFEAAFDMIKRHFRTFLETVPDLIAGQDFKSRLQEAVQSKIKEVPRYRVVEEQGPDHDKTFCVALTVGPITTQGMGKSKKMAEQEAARKALEMIGPAATRGENPSIGEFKV